MPDAVEMRAQRLDTWHRVRTSLQRDSLADFVRGGWHVLEKRDLEWGWHLDAICMHLEAVADGRIQRLLINVPPGHMKSLLTVVFFPAWMWLRRPEWRVICGSYAEALAVRDSLRCRRLIGSDFYRGSFGIDWRLSDDQNRKDSWEFTSGGGRQCVSVGGGATGFRADCTIIDDPLNAMDRYSQACRLEAIRWIDTAMSTRLNDPRQDARIMIMQRLHDEDPAGHVLRQGGYVHLCLPSEYRAPGCETPIGWRDPRTRPGELLFPAVYDASVLEQARRELGSLDYSCQHQQDPVPAEGQIFKERWLRARYDRLPPLREVWSAWDTALRTGRDNDESVRTTVGLGHDGLLYVLEMEHGRWETPEVAQRLVRSARRWRDLYPVIYRGDYIEESQAGLVLMQYLRQDAPDVVTHGVKPDRDKAARAQAVAPVVETGRLLFPSEETRPECKEWVGAIIRDLLTFPGARHDDITDSVVYAILVMLTRGRPVSGAYGGAAVSR